MNPFYSLADLLEESQRSAGLYTDNDNNEYWRSCWKQFEQAATSSRMLAGKFSLLPLAELETILEQTKNRLYNILGSSAYMNKEGPGAEKCKQLVHRLRAIGNYLQGKENTPNRESESKLRKSIDTLIATPDWPDAAKLRAVADAARAIAPDWLGVKIDEWEWDVTGPGGYDARQLLANAAVAEEFLPRLAYARGAGTERSPYPHRWQQITRSLQHFADTFLGSPKGKPGAPLKYAKAKALAKQLRKQKKGWKEIWKECAARGFEIPAKKESFQRTFRRTLNSR